MFYATGYHHHDGTFPTFVRKTMMVRRAVDNMRRQAQESHHMQDLSGSKEQQPPTPPPMPLPSPCCPEDQEGEDRPSEDTRIYRPSSTRAQVVSAVSSTSSMAASECGSTTLLLPNRSATTGAGGRHHHHHHHHHQNQQQRARDTTTSAVSSTTSVGVSECGSTALLIPQHQHPKQHKPSCRHHPDKQYLREGNMRELNLLISTPHVPDLRPDKGPKTDLHQPGEGPGQDDDDDDSVEIGVEHEQPVINFAPQVMAALSVSLGSMVVGFASAYTSPALVSMEKTNMTFEVSKQEASWIGGLMPLAALLGGIAGGPLIEGLGRRTTILGTAVPFIISWFLIALAFNVPMILAGRAIAGFCVGVASLSLPVYLGETVQPEVRGMLGLLPTTLGNVGILACFVSGKYLDWSTLAMLGGCIPVPFLICMFLIPETPRWYLSKNKPKKARKALQWLRGSKTDITTEMNEIEKAATEADKNSSDSSRCSELFSKQNLRPLLITVGLMFFQQMSGINAVIFYATNIFKDAGSTIDENLCTIIIGIVNFLSTFVATMLIDRLGRKILLYMSSVAMTITLLALGTFFFVRDVKEMDVTDFGWLPLACLVVFVVGFSIGFGPIPWLMMGEILPSKIRGSAASLATAFNWSCTFIVTKTFADLMTGIGAHGGFWMFGTVCLVGLFFVIFFVPETQGKTLEDIEKKLTGQRMRRMSSVANLKPLPMAV